AGIHGWNFCVNRRRVWLGSGFTNFWKPVQPRGERVRTHVGPVVAQAPEQRARNWRNCDVADAAGQRRASAQKLLAADPRGSRIPDRTRCDRAVESSHINPWSLWRSQGTGAILAAI